MSTHYESPQVGGPTVQRVWTTVAAEIDGQPVADARGSVRIQRERAFAYRADAERWLNQHAECGWTPAGINAYATRYHGPTDSRSNAWLAHAYIFAPADVVA